MHVLSKTTTNKAARNGLAITPYKATNSRTGETYETIEIAELVDDEPADEFLAAYRVNRDGSFTYDTSCRLRDSDHPAHIRSEQQLRDLLPEFAALITA